MSERNFRTRLKTFTDLEERCKTSRGCLIWTGKLSPSGNPVCTQGGKNTMVRRWAFQRANGYLPAVVGDTCGNKLCCNHKHLIPQTYSEVRREAVANERHPELKARRVAMARERLGLTKVNRSQAEVIRASSEPRSALAARYGISLAQVGKIQRGESWPPLGAGAALLAGASVFALGGLAA